eukprot:2005376-Amphidinium_carterae.1
MNGMHKPIEHRGNPSLKRASSRGGIRPLQPTQQQTASAAAMAALPTMRLAVPATQEHDDSSAASAYSSENCTLGRHSNGGETGPG